MAIIRRLSFLFPLLAVVIGVFGGIYAVHADGSEHWEIPQQIPALEDYNLTPVYLSWHESVYCFSVQKIKDQFAISISQWKLGQGWTLPKDIFTNPLKNELDVLDVLLEEDGTVHLILFAGDQFVANIYYSQAKIWDVDRVQAWSPLAVVGEIATPPPAGQIIRDSEGKLVVIYSGKSDGNGLYAVFSSDQGVTWSNEPSLIYATNEERLKPYSLEIIRDQNGDLHAVWSDININGNGDFVYYAKSQSDSKIWTADKLAVGFGTIGSYTPTITVYRNELFVVYHNDAPTTRWMRRSKDLGRTWEPAVRLFQQIGSNGPVSFVVDSSDQLHMFFGNRIGNPAIHGMWHSQWDGTRWFEPVAVVSGPRITDMVGESSFDPSFARAVIVEGNLIFLAWRTDPGGRPNGHWYTYEFVDSPRVTSGLSSTSMTTQLPSSTKTAPIATPEGTFQPDPSPEIFLTSSSSANNEPTVGLIVALSVIPALAIVAVILATRLRLHS